MSPIDPIALAQALVRLDTSGPEAREEPAVALLAPLLSAAGFTVETHDFAPGRPSLLARLDKGHERPLVLSGHLDTVPVGAVAWGHAPFGAALSDGFLHGRGSADMKGGIAALVAAAISVAQDQAAVQSLVIILTAGEETGCLGAMDLQRRGLLPPAAGIVVAEPTGNRLALGHRGALWLQAGYVGRNAHGSTPHLGHNAIYDAADGITRCRGLAFPDRDTLLGPVTLNIGTVNGGININSVPDQACFTIDVRSVVPRSHERLRGVVADCLGATAAVETLIDLPAVRTQESDPFARRMARSLRALGQSDEAVAVPFFTDASILGEACAAPSIILGPGESAMAHRTDERCSLDQIVQATVLYEHLLRSAD